MSGLPKPLFNSPVMGFAHHKIILDDAGKPCDYVFLEVNSTFEKLTGLQKSAILGRTVLEVMPGIVEDDFKWIDTCGAVALGAEARSFTTFSVTLQKWFDVQLYSEEHLHFSALFFDITASKKHQEIQDHAEKRLNVILESTPDSIWSINSSYEILYLNRSFQQEFELVFGVKLTEGTNILRALPPELQKIWKPRYDRALKGEQLQFDDVIEAFGQNIYIEVRSNPVYTNNKLTSVSFFGRDITEKVRAEQAYKESSERLNSIISSLNDVIWSVSLPDFRILYLSPQAEALYGYPVQAFYDNPQLWQDIAHPDDRPILDNALKTIFETGSSVRESRVIHPDGTIKWVLDKATLVYNEKGEGVRIDGIASDISVQKKLELELNEAAKKLDLFSRHLPGVLYQLKMQPDGYLNFPYASEEFKHQYNTSPEAAAADAKNVFKAIHPDDLPQVQQAVMRSAETLDTLNISFRVNQPDGSVMWAEALATPQKQDDGSVLWHGFTQNITDRKMAVQELQVFKSIADKAVYGEAISDLDGNLIYANQFFAEVHGYTIKEISGANLRIFYDEEHIEDVAGLVKQLISTGTFEPTLVWHRHKNGKTFPMLMSGVLISDETGAPQYMGSTAIDISRQYYTEQQLLESKKQLSGISDNIPDGLVYQLISRPGYRKFSYISAGVNKLHGIRVEDVLLNPDSLYGQILPEDAMKLAQKEQRSIDTLSVFECEYRIKHPDDGSLRWLKASSTPRKLPNGDILWDGIEIDITKSKKAEEELMRLSQAVEQSPASVVITDIAGNITYVNPTFTELTGYSRDEAMGQNPRILKSGHQPEHFYEQLWQTIVSGKTWKGELLNHKKNGQPYWESATISPIKNQQGEITSYLAVKENITDRKKATEELRKSEEKYRIVADNTYHWEFWEIPSGELLYNSPACERVSGYTAQEFIDDPELIIRILHPDDRGHYLAHRKKTWTTPEPDRCVFRIFHKTGEIRYIEHVCQPAYDNNGTFLGVRGTNIDITQRKLIENKLIESEKRFREIFELLPVISVQGYNEKREVIYWNEASEHLYGYKREEAMGQKLENLIIPDQARDQVICEIRNWIEHGEPIPSAELTLKHKNGNPVHVFSNHVLIINMKGQAELYCIDLDLTELKQKEKDLRQSEERYRSVIRVSKTGAWEYLTHENRLWCSPEYFTMLGYSPHDFSDSESTIEIWTNLIHPDDRQEASDRFATFISEGMQGTYENYFRMLHKNGGFVWIWSRGQNLPAADGSVSDIVLGVHIDITGIREAEAKIRDSELYYPSLLQTIPDMVFVLDKNGTFMDFKVPSDTNLYVSPDQIIGGNVNRLMPAEIALQQMDTIRLALAEPGVYSFDYELSISGKPQFFSAITTAFGQDRVITTVRDVTDYKEKLDEIKKLLDIEEKQTRSLRDFTHIVSHNLRIHTANMIGIFMMLELDEPELYDTQYIQMLKESSENLEETIMHLNKVLDFKLSSDLVWEDIDLHEVVQKILQAVHQLAEGTGVSLINDVAPKTIIRGVYPFLNGVILNLVTNGIKFKSEQKASYVKISSDSDTGHTFIYCEDNGLGIDLERHRSKLFGMYKKFHSDRESKGLGLFVAKNQIEAMGGQIDVQSEVNKGTTFIISIPHGKN